MQTGTEPQFQWLEGIIKAVLILNLIDALATVFWVRLGFATEANPFMASLVHQHPVIFVTTKTTLVALCSYLLWLYRRRPVAVVSIFLALIAYYAVLLQHVRYITEAILVEMHR